MSLAKDTNPKDISNCWTSNYSRKNDGYITHAILINGGGRALCGVEIQDSGGIELGEGGWSPGCLKCKRVLVKASLITPDRRVVSGEKVANTTATDRTNTDSPV